MTNAVMVAGLEFIMLLLTGAVVWWCTRSCEYILKETRQVVESHWSKTDGDGVVTEEITAECCTRNDQ